MKEANTQTELRYRLAEMINEMLKNNSAFSILHSSFAVSASDIVIFDYNFLPAQVGIPENRSGANGFFEFRVTPPETRSSAYNDGIIIATSYDDVANEQLTMNNEQLRAWVQNGMLYVKGLMPGKSWHIYSLYGQLIYTGIADGDRRRDARHCVSTQTWRLHHPIRRQSHKTNQLTLIKEAPLHYGVALLL